MGQRYGRSIEDPMRIAGSEGRDLDAALARYRLFHQKQPIDIVEIDHEPPKLVVPVGDCVSVMYRCDKWYEDGQDVDYKHLHGKSEELEYEPGAGTRFYSNADLEPEDRARFGTTKLKYPKAWARLGKCLGWFVRRDDDDDPSDDLRHTVNPRNAWLLTAPDGHMLAIYAPHKLRNGDVGFLGFIQGGRLRVLKDGIDG